MHYDVAVVGTGPAGGTAACRLADSGLTAVIVEKDTLPRPKACGGAMSVRVQDLLDWDFATLIEARTSCQHFIYSDDQECDVKRTPTPMLLVERGPFDQHFITRALDRGEGRIVLRQGVTIKSAREDADGVTLSTTDGERIRTRYLIAADGAASPVARSLGIYRRAAGAAIDAAVVLDRPVFDRERDHATFDVQCVADGYGWSFPKSDHLSCGVGIWRRPRNLKSHLNDYLGRSFPRGSIRSVTRLAHPVPVFQEHRPIATPRTCLTGDAAHLVDPVVGEGIVYAIESGGLAADVVASLCRGDRTLPGSVDAESGRAAAADEIGNLFERYRDCHIYQHIVRYGIARRLNLIRLESMAQWIAPAAMFGALAAA